MLNEAFFGSVRKSLFGGHFTQLQVDGLNKIDNAWQAYGDKDRRKEAYVFATAYHETAQKMQPIEEYGGEVYLKGKPYYPYYGRGLVQLTWVANYKDWGKRLDVDLAKQPELALSWKYAGRILVQGMMLGTFTGKKLGDFIVNGGACNFEKCRAIINGTDKASLIAGYAAHFLQALEASVSAPQPLPVATTLMANAAKVPPPPDVEPTSFDASFDNSFGPVTNLSPAGETKMALDQYPSTATVPVKSAALSKINWVALAGVAIPLLARFGLKVDAQTLVDIMTAVISVGFPLIAVLRTWFSKSVTSSSVKP